jgi:dihydroorotase
MSELLISNGTIVNQGRQFRGYLLVRESMIAEVGEGDFTRSFRGNRIDADGKIVMPGAIDVHVHFREPGLTTKGDMTSESRAAVAGGVTTVLEMPNTQPPTTSLDALERKFDIAVGRMHTNYSFYLGATNDNLAEIKRLNSREVCGVKLFMGSSTGNMLVDSHYALSALFAESPVVISAHCEDEAMIRANAEVFRRSNPRGPASIHPQVRTAEACYRSSATAVELADRYSARLHVAHLTTARELALFDAKPYSDKRITAEACVPHLWFAEGDYSRLANRIKCNPAIKTARDRTALREALSTGKIDAVATDHAPHTRAEKRRTYWHAPSGIPMVQHSLVAMMQLVSEGVLSIETLVERMCHAPATIFSIADRGFLRAGYKADITIIDPAFIDPASGEAGWVVTPESILSKCGWSPLEGEEFNSRVTCTIVNGRVVYDGGGISHETFGERLVFDR